MDPNFSASSVEHVDSPSAAHAPDGISGRKSSLVRLYVRLVVTAVGCLAGPGLLMVMLGVESQGHAFLAVIGAALGHASFAAAWVAMGDDVIRRRVITAALGLALTASLCVLMLWPAHPAAADEIVAPLVIVLAAMFVSALAAFGFLRLRYRLRISDRPTTRVGDFQLSLRDLLVGTALSGLLFGGAKIFFADGEMGVVRNRDFLISWGLLVLSMMVGVSLLTWAALSAKWRRKLAFALTVWVLMTVLESWILLFGVYYQESFLEQIIPVGVINASTVAALAAHLVVARGCGYRLHAATS